MSTHMEKLRQLTGITSLKPLTIIDKAIELIKKQNQRIEELEKLRQLTSTTSLQPSTIINEAIELIRKQKQRIEELEKWLHREVDSDYIL